MGFIAYMIESYVIFTVRLNYWLVNYEFENLKAISQTVQYVVYNPFYPFYINL